MSIAPSQDVDLNPESLIGPVVDSDEKSTIRQGPHVYYSLASAAFLGLTSLPCLLFPRILSLVFARMLTDTPDAEGHPEILRQLNPLERSLAGLAGLSCLSLAAILVVQTGSLPLTSSLTASSAVASASSSAPFRAPTILVSMAYFALFAWYTYELHLWALAIPSAGLTVWGLWALLFAHEGIVNREGKPNVDNQGYRRKAEKKDL
ncbi:hypothetical protein OIO90_001636 [Microbotryomycetes sp. JL221]|nr:hypothetical protein OIO90_001636 [Microbotryomycetes sp. JL221]